MASETADAVAYNAERQRLVPLKGAINKTAILAVHITSGNFETYSLTWYLDQQAGYWSARIGLMLPMEKTK